MELRADLLKQQPPGAMNIEVVETETGLDAELADTCVR